MSQHARPIGPTTANPPAAFSPEMAIGARPSQPLRFTTRAAFGSQMLSPITPVNAPFSMEMSAGAKPDRGCQLVPAKPGWSVAQSSHVAAPFAPDMAAGSKPDRNREALPLRTGLVAQTPDVPVFGSEMVVGSRPDRNRESLPPRPGYIAQTPLVPPFSVEMVQGWHPDRPALNKPQPGGWQSTQTTPVAAPFGLDMAQGVAGARGRVFFAHLGLSIVPLQVDFSFESTLGSRPDAIRLAKLHNGGWFIAQTTHGNAPFSLDMAQGARPERRRPYPLQVGWMILPQQQDFSFESVLGWHPDSARLRGRVPSGWQAPPITPVSAPFGPEMSAGQHPDTPRLFVKPRLGLQLDQATPTGAPFSIDMVAGSQPPRPRLRRSPWVPSLSYVDIGLSILGAADIVLRLSADDYALLATADDVACRVFGDAVVLRIGTQTLVFRPFADDEEMSS